MTQSTSEPWGSHGPSPLAPDLCFLLTSGNQESFGSSPGPGFLRCRLCFEHARHLVWFSLAMLVIKHYIIYIHMRIWMSIYPSG